MTRTKYEALPGLSYSGLKELLRSPAHYNHWLNNPREETKALRLGKAAHAAFLTPDIWASTYKSLPETLDRRTKDGKATYEAILASMKPGDTLLSFDEYELATEIAQAASRIADNLIYRTGAWVERVLQGNDKFTLIKGIPDLIDSEGWIYDLKTTDDASERAAVRTILNYGYHLQAAHYIRLAHCNRSDIRGFRLVMVEKEAPHQGAVYEISGDLLDLGRKETERAYSIYDRCVASGEWPGYSEAGNVITLSDLPGSKAKAGATSLTF
jgi:hypothetical protein